MKKVIAIISAVLITISVIIPAFALQSKGESGKLIYEIVDGEAHITATQSDISGVVDIPEKLDGCPVTTICNGAFWHRSFVNRVNMPSVITIEDEAFDSCTGLKEADMPKVQNIGKWAFNGCPQLSTINAPETVNVGDRAFNGSAITGVKMPKATFIDQYAFINCTSLVKASFDSLTEILPYTFQRDTALTELYIPNVTKIGNFSLSGCINLKNIIFAEDNPVYRAIDGILYDTEYKTLLLGPAAVDVNVPESVTKIADNAFRGSADLKTITTANVTEIGNYSFYGCTKLTSVKMPCVVSVGEDAFDSCTALSSLEAPELVNVGKYAFAYTGIPTLRLPKAKVLGENSFSNCTQLVAANIPEAEIVGDYAFYDCSGLVAVSLPSATYIGNRAYYGCKSVETAFMANATYLGSSCFNQCDKLKSVTFYNDAPKVEYDPFYKVHEDMKIYCSNKAQGFTTPTWQGFPCERVNAAGYYIVTFVDGITDNTLSKWVTQNGAAAHAPEVPEHDGYIFTGWDRSFSSVKADMTVTAQFTDGYSVKYFVDDELYKTDYYQEGETIIAADAPEKVGYTFSGWSDIPETMPAHNIEVFGSFTINVYEVTFVDMDDTVIDTQKVEYGASAKAPEAPLHEGYVFTGWDKEFSYITKDITVKAVYVEEGTEPTPTPTTDPTTEPFIPGDVNGDGNVNTGDAVLVLKFSAEIETPTDEQKTAADVTHDGNVNTGDAVMILKFAANMITEF